MVRGQDAESVESCAGFERIFGWTSLGDCGRMRGVQHRVGDTGIDLFAIDALRLHGVATDVWFCAADWRDGIVVEHGQTGADLPLGGGLRAGVECYLRTGRKR